MQLEQLGPYRLARRLGRGGMGTVFEGVNLETAQPAAIKVLNPHLAVEEGFRERFEVEIETLKKLKHPNIVRLYGFGQQDGVIFYAMELVHGTNLEDELQAGRRFNWRETTRLGIKLARALQHAHDHGVIHRDLKPANLLLTLEDDLKLADFGIARLFGNTRLTSAGGLVGTAEYMAPEQADGRGVTPQCDLYSLGGVLFAMLAGRPPFWGGSLPEVLQMHRFAEPPPVSRFAPDVPAELGQIIDRLLSKDPSARGTNARVVAKQLAAMEHALSMPRTVVPGGTSKSMAVPPAATRSNPDAAMGASASPPNAHDFEVLSPDAATRAAGASANAPQMPPGQIPRPTADMPLAASNRGGDETGPPRRDPPALPATLAASLPSTPSHSAFLPSQPSAAALASVVPEASTAVSPSSAGGASAELIRTANRSSQVPPEVGAVDRSAKPGAATAKQSAADGRNAGFGMFDSGRPASVASGPAASGLALAGSSAGAPAVQSSNAPFGTGAASVLVQDPRSGDHAATRAENRFVTVEEDERLRAAADEAAHGSGWIQIGLLSLALATLIALGYYMMRPPSADKLYSRIEAVAGAAGPPERLLDAEDNVQEFLSRYPTDPRAPQLKAYAEEIELVHLKRQAELNPLLARGPASDPIARDYAEAIRDAANNPERTAAKLQAILDFYAQSPDRSESTSRYLELSRRQLALERQQISKIASAYLKLIDANLSQAARLRATDPAKARTIWSSIVELYASKPWAADRVAKARAELKATTQ